MTWRSSSVRIAHLVLHDVPVTLIVLGNVPRTSYSLPADQQLEVQAFFGDTQRQGVAYHQIGRFHRAGCPRRRRFSTFSFHPRHPQLLRPVPLRNAASFSGLSTPIHSDVLPSWPCRQPPGRISSQSQQSSHLLKDHLHKNPRPQRANLPTAQSVSLDKRNPRLPHTYYQAVAWLRQQSAALASLLVIRFKLVKTLWLRPARTYHAALIDIYDIP